MSDIKTNDVWLMKGDCLERMKEIESGSVDLILTDPPYGTTACKWDSVIDLPLMWEQLKRIIKPNGAIVLFGAEPFTSVLVLSNVSSFREKLVWVKHKPSNFACGRYMHMKYSEDVIVFVKGKPTYNPQMQERKSDRVAQMQKGMSKKWNTVRKDGEEVSMQTQYAPKEWQEYDPKLKFPSNILEIPAVASNSKEKVNHPTQKPVALYEWLLTNYAKKGQRVFDSHLGSGSSAIAAHYFGVDFVGCELDKDYFDAAKARFDMATKQLAMSI